MKEKIVKDKEENAIESIIEWNSKNRKYSKKFVSIRDDWWKIVKMCLMVMSSNMFSENY